jgi:hypothetical protein
MAQCGRSLLRCSMSENKLFRCNRRIFRHSSTYFLLFYFYFFRDRINSELIVTKEGALYHLWAEPPIHPILKVGFKQSCGLRSRIILMCWLWLRVKLLTRLCIRVLPYYMYTKQTFFKQTKVNVRARAIFSSDLL